jgi:hypothetical protein
MTIKVSNLESNLMLPAKWKSFIKAPPTSGEGFGERPTDPKYSESGLENIFD